MTNDLPREVEIYNEEPVQHLVDHLKERLVGVYLFGSASYDAYEPGLSDLHNINLEPANKSSHWYLLDIATERELGRNLHGPRTVDVFAAIPRRWTLEVNSVLNACRGWRFIITGEFSSKVNGAKWALEQQDCPVDRCSDIVNDAIEARKTGDNLVSAWKLPVAQVMAL
ncbi:hypothetical protein PENSTE_c004G03645 [Penicillium steckii]|uniref:Adenylyltransferase AadA C-terminal domain-containing protein n=1 Tax=Penicillium steckii TaxID=303698 RepID=A0A1V6TP20_9EURO|nr:hypothetical protein PENSTE_c004G03645 [Penicillium steckii]